MIEVRHGHVAVVGSGLAGLAAAREAARGGAAVTVLSPGRAGRDGSSHRVHALAPWILLTAPWVKGDSPRRFHEDLRRRGEGLVREAPAASFAEQAHEMAEELLEVLDLAPIERTPALLPGDSVPRGLRCLPRRRDPLLAPLLAECAHAGVLLRDRSLVVGLVVEGRRVVGVVGHDRLSGESFTLAADAVVLACGGPGAVFPHTTASRWCRGSGLALAGAAGALLHQPHLTQALPVTATPPLYFPTTAALLAGRILLGDQPLPPQATLEAAAREIALALRQARHVTLEPLNGDGLSLLPQRVRESATFAREGRVPLTLAAHHGIGGVAIDAAGRTSLAGLWACGEAAGGVQGRSRMMGTGLLEAWIFGVAAGRTAARDVTRRAATAGSPGAAVTAARLTPPLPEAPERLERLLDELLEPLIGVRSAAEAKGAVEKLAAWPVAAAAGGGASTEAAWLAAIRCAAALAMLRHASGERAEAPAAAPAREEEERWSSSG